MTRYLGQIRAIFQGADGRTRLLVQQYTRALRERRLLPHKAQSWHLMTRDHEPLEVVDVGSELCDTAFVLPALQASTPLPLPREGMAEIFWLARDRYFPVHKYPSKVYDDGLERGEGEGGDSDSE